MLSAHEMGDVRASYDAQAAHAAAAAVPAGDAAGAADTPASAAKLARQLLDRGDLDGAESLLRASLAAGQRSLGDAQLFV